MRPRRTPLIAIATAVLSAGALTAALLTTGTAATAEPATTSHAATSAQTVGVPWSHVGRGWVLVQYTTAAPEGGKAGPVTLYLISPGGAGRMGDAGRLGVGRDPGGEQGGGKMQAHSAPSTTVAVRLQM